MLRLYITVIIVLMSAYCTVGEAWLKEMGFISFEKNNKK